MAKSKEKLEAIKLRSGGESIKVIAKNLNVSPGSVSSWCKNVKLTKEQIHKLELRAKDPYYGKRLSYSLNQQRIRKEKTKKLLNEGIKEVGELNDREFFLTGAALYWAEGFKKDSQAGLASLDPIMIKFFIKWLKLCFGYSNNDLSFRITLNESHKYRLKDIEGFWQNLLGVDKTYFQKPYFQKTVWKKVYEKPENYKGILRVKVRKSTYFLRKIHGFIEGLRLEAELE